MLIQQIIFTNFELKSSITHDYIYQKQHKYKNIFIDALVTVLWN